LDPRISYTALQDEFKDDLELASDLKASRSKLQTYFKDNYLSRRQRPLVPTTSTSSISSDSSVATGGPRTVSRSPQKNFTARFNQRKRTPSDELLEFWSLPQEDFDTCNPLQWWLGRRSQFPNLYCLARDIFSIPGKPPSLISLHAFIISLS
jgi:hypothetical protein